jgi:O-acetyl-ADP-ribose deacetylase (regulator of RNase III)
MKEIEGNLIALMKEFKFQVMAHGANCFCTMGAGIAKQVREEFPEAWEADQKTIKGDITKLGNYTFADYRWNGQFAFRVINAYTQYGHNPLEKPFDYEAFTLCMRKINFNHKGMTIGLPLIGAGLARGNWARIDQIIKDELKDMDVTIVKYVPYGAENANKINQLLKSFDDGQTK